MSSKISRRAVLASALATPAALHASQPGTSAALPIRTLGKTGLKVTALGFGCAWTADSSVFTRGLDAGINHFDTAPVYEGGHAETMLRGGLGKNRAKVVLSTKTEASSKLEALAQLDRSLTALGTDYIDIWYLHSKDSPDGIREELIEAQEAAKKQGKTRFIGVSTHRLPRVVDKILATGKMDVVLAAHNFAMGAEVDAAAAKLAQAGIGLVMMKALAGGRSPAQQSEGPRIVGRPEAVAAAIRWALARPHFASVLVGMVSHDEVDDALASIRKPFGGEDTKVLATRLREISPFYCRTCGNCDGACVRGLPIPDMLRYAMYAENYGQFAAAREHFNALPVDMRQVHCADCSNCTVQCPNGVRVQDRLSAAQNWFA